MTVRGASGKTVVNVWLRGDGSRDLGLGHIMRLIAIAESARERGLAPTFVVATSTERFVREILAREGLDVLGQGSDEELWLERVSSPDVIIFDGYHLSSKSMARASTRVAGVAAFDDFGNIERPVDVLVDPSSAGRPAEVGSSRHRLLGPLYAPVRRMFLKYRRERSGARGRLVAVLGSSDVRNMNSELLAALTAQTTFSESVLVAGPGSGALTGNGKVGVVRSPPDIARLFSDADAVITAGGVTMWEVLSMGLPSALVKVAENQSRAIRTATEAEAALEVANHSRLRDALMESIEQLGDLALQAQLSANACALVDGRGSDRILNEVLRFPSRSKHLPRQGRPSR